MKSIKKLLVAGLLMCGAASAQATDYALGTLVTGENLISPKTVAVGSFLDNISFTLSGLSNDSFGVGALNFSVASTDFYNIVGLNLSLFDSSNASVASGTNFTVNALSAGNYTLQVTGNATGIYGGVYAGGVTVTPVPEPDASTAMLAGLLMLGFMAFRRRDQY